MRFRDVLVRTVVVALFLIGVMLAIAQVPESTVALSMSTVGNWLVQNWLVISLFVGGIVTIFLVNDWRNARDAAKGLFLLAEKALANLAIATGPEAMQAVVEALYTMLPSRAKTILSLVATLMGTTPEEVLQSLVQRWYNTIKQKYGVDFWAGMVQAGARSGASKGAL